MSTASARPFRRATSSCSYPPASHFSVVGWRVLPIGMSEFFACGQDVQSQTFPTPFRFDLVTARQHLDHRPGARVSGAAQGPDDKTGMRPAVVRLAVPRRQKTGDAFVDYLKASNVDRSLPQLCAEGKYQAAYDIAVAEIAGFEKPSEPSHVPEGALRATCE